MGAQHVWTRSTPTIYEGVQRIEHELETSFYLDRRVLSFASDVRHWCRILALAATANAPDRAWGGRGHVLYRDPVEGL